MSRDRPKANNHFLFETSIGMRRLRHARPSLWEGFRNEEVTELWEPWMREVDDIVADHRLLATIFVGTGAAPYAGPSSQNPTPARRP